MSSSEGPRIYGYLHFTIGNGDKGSFSRTPPRIEFGMTSHVVALIDNCAYDELQRQSQETEAALRKGLAEYKETNERIRLRETELQRKIEAYEKEPITIALIKSAQRNLDLHDQIEELQRKLEKSEAMVRVLKDSQLRTYDGLAQKADMADVYLETLQTIANFRAYKDAGLDMKNLAKKALEGQLQRNYSEKA